LSNAGFLEEKYDFYRCGSCGDSEWVRVVSSGVYNSGACPFAIRVFGFRASLDHLLIF
jgi:hypothetical protein